MTQLCAKNGERKSLELQGFPDVINRAVRQSNRSSVARRWGTSEQNLRRWSGNGEPVQSLASPDFNTLIGLLRHMDPSEQLDVARILFRKTPVSDRLQDDLSDPERIAEAARLLTKAQALVGGLRQ